MTHSKKLILPITKSKTGQKTVTIPRKIKTLDEGDYVIVEKVKEVVLE